MALKLNYLDKYGYPVERIKGRWFLNFLRLLIHTRELKIGEWKESCPQKTGNSDVQQEN